MIHRKSEVSNEREVMSYHGPVVKTVSMKTALLTWK
jgi:hypothetical protein